MKNLRKPELQYFLQVHECAMEPKKQVKINKWDWHTGYPAIWKRLSPTWHYFFEKEEILKHLEDEASLKNITMYLLKTFYLMPYDESQDFYSQFQERLEKGCKAS